MSCLGRSNTKCKRKMFTIMMCMLGCFVLGCIGIGAGKSVINVAYAAEENEVFVPSEVPAPEFSVEAGFYEEAFELVLTAPEGAEIYYTLDGSVPTPENANAMVYMDPIAVELCDSVKGRELLTATVVRAVTVTADGACSDVVTHTYFVANRMLKRYDVPVVSWWRIRRICTGKRPVLLPILRKKEESGNVRLILSIFCRREQGKFP